MMNFVEKAKQAKEKMMEIENRSTSNIGAWKDLYDDAKREILMDKMLSESGKHQKIEELNKTMGRQLLEMLAKEKNEYRQAVVEAENNAKRELANPLKKPHDLDIAINDQTIQKIELDALFSRKSEVVRSISDYADKIDNPYFAEQLLGKLPTLMDRLGPLESAEMAKLKSAYHQLQDRALTEEKKEAKALLSSVENAFGRKLYNQLHEDVVASRAGVEFSRHLNDAESKLEILD
ncbi:hypothetical protein [Halalkalibacterium halodurans]|uniref:Uncharacterized protein n=1 Tax=Halalkalibacterium halodurans TaxID=86665 RepID=A0A0M0KJ92_ALKHA|nr:hypothetical protein [Halalkalibacterium halodurans]TPE68952.1 hypothetical protein AMD02_010920 [Halalkalibacterium halodurans]